jgi:hypothetical protein
MDSPLAALSHCHVFHWNHCLQHMEWPCPPPQELGHPCQERNKHRGAMHGMDRHYLPYFFGLLTSPPVQHHHPTRSTGCITCINDHLIDVADQAQEARAEAALPPESHTMRCVQLPERLTRLTSRTRSWWLAPQGVMSRFSISQILLRSRRMR